MKKLILSLLLISTLLIASGCNNTTGNNTKQDTAQTTADNVTTKPEDTTQAVTNPPIKEETVTETNTPLLPAFQMVNGEKRYGYINNTGNFSIDPIYTYASEFSDNVAIVQNSNKSQVIDKDGEVLFESEFNIQPFHNGVAIISELTATNLLKGYIDTTGKSLIQPKYILADDFNEDGTAYVSTDVGKFSLIDKTGTVLEEYLLDTKYNNVLELDDGYIIYADSDTGYMGVVNLKGEVILEPNFGDISYLNNDLFVVKEVNELYYQMNTNPAAIYNNEGEQLTDYTLYELTEYYGDYASATDDKYTYFIDKLGKEVTELPKLEGRGTLKFIDDIIQAEIDQRLLYLTKENEVIWQNDNTITFESGLIVKEMKLKPNKFVTVYYPQIEGLETVSIQNKINEELTILFTEQRKDLKAEDELSVEDSFIVTLNGNLLEVLRMGYDYYFGAAHGMPIRDYIYIDLTTGEFYELKDLFKEDSNYVKVISDSINIQMQDRIKNDSDAMFFEDSFKEINENQYFILTEDSLIIYFYPYDISAYAAGFPEFEIPYEELKDIINYDGELWKAFH